MNPENDNNNRKFTDLMWRAEITGNWLDSSIIFAAEPIYLAVLFVWYICF